jgi:hypothetical protein
MRVRSKIWGFISLGIGLLGLVVPSLRYAPRTYIFFLLRIWTVFVPSLALRKILAVAIVLPTTILLTAVPLINSELLFRSCSAFLMLGLDMVVNILLVGTTHFESIKSPFSEYLCAMFPYPGQDLSCSICLHEINGWDDGAKLACDHSYHKECIDQWFATQLYSCLANNTDYQISCPLCRLDLIRLSEMIKNRSDFWSLN